MTARQRRNAEEQSETSETQPEQSEGYSPSGQPEMDYATAIERAMRAAIPDYDNLNDDERIGRWSELVKRAQKNLRKGSDMSAEEFSGLANDALRDTLTHLIYRLNMVGSGLQPAQGVKAVMVSISIDKDGVVSAKKVNAKTVRGDRKLDSVDTPALVLYNEDEITSHNRRVIDAWLSEADQNEIEVRKATVDEHGRAIETVESSGE